MKLIVAFVVVLGGVLIYGMTQGVFDCFVLAAWVISIILVFRTLKKRESQIFQILRPWTYMCTAKIPLLRYVFFAPRLWLLLSSFYILTEITGLILAIHLLLFSNPLQIIKDFRWLPLQIAIIGAIYYAVYDVSIIQKVFHYKDTEYCKWTGYSRKEVLNEKSLWGEFLAYALCDKVPGHKRIIFNAMIPKYPSIDGFQDFAEIDMICIAQTGIHVIEAKNRGGVLCGGALDTQWEQEIGKQKNTLYNPILQNQNHIIILSSFLFGPGLQPWDNPADTAWRELAPDAQFFNHIFLADPFSDIAVSGTMPANTVATGVYNMVEIIGRGERVLADEEIDCLAEILEGTMDPNPIRREAAVQARINWQKVAPTDSKFYFIQVEYPSLDTHLYRFTSAGVARYGTHDGFWYPVRRKELANWKQRLPYCNGAGYTDLTSFEDARDFMQQVNAIINSPQRQELENHILAGTLANYLYQQLNCRYVVIYVK